ncbi:DNA-methyltransferase [Candidatus Darwinibacter acetoxidans]
MRHTILHADVMAGLASMPDESIQCVMTSPPYWGLRDYGIEGQIGLEPTLEAYVEKMVEVFREVRRVLRDDGTLWLNLGDCYARSRSAWGLKPKNLVGIPWRVAFALQADGWYLRSDIIWHKPNPMPESVRDRPTKSHEHVFLLSKRPRYFYDADAIREKAKNAGKKGKGGYTAKVDETGFAVPDFLATKEHYYPSHRNRRDVWRIATQPMPEAHFATFPEKLVEPCIKAGTSARGACPECGAPWRRVTERSVLPPPDRKHNNPFKKDPLSTNGEGATTLRNEVKFVQTGWAPTCACGTGETVPCVVLDPFAGSGTVNLVAHGLGRSSVGIELSGEYIDIIKSRWARGGRPAEALEVRAI